MANIKIALPTVLIFLGIASCKPLPSISTATDTSQSTRTKTITPINIKPIFATLNPTATFLSSRTQSQSLTPFLAFPDLHTAGPFLLLGNYIHELDGSGHRQITLPEDNNDSFSPDMHWYAFITGDLDGNDKLPEGGVVLHVINIWTEEKRDIANLVPNDFFARQKIMTEVFRQAYLSHSQGPIPDYIEINVDDAIQFSLKFLFSWSPNSQYLAFAAMIDGHSSDVYLYNIDTQTIQRKESSGLNVGSLSWSPDSHWIIYSNNTPSLNLIDLYYTPVHAVSINIDNSNINFGDVYPIDWISDVEWLTTSDTYGDGGPGWIDLSAFNIITGIKASIWQGLWASYAIDKNDGLIILYAQDPCLKNYCNSTTFHVYEGPMYGHKIQLTVFDPGYDYSLMLRNGSLHSFLAFSTDSYSKVTLINGIRNDGSIDPLVNGKDISISLSPDFHWLTIFGDGGITILDESDQVLAKWDNSPVFNVAWKTNSQGLFFMTDSQVYYFSMDNFKTKLIFNCQPNECGKGQPISLVPSTYLQILPYLRVQPPSIEKQTQGNSFWSKTSLKDLPQPGANEYSVTIPAYSERRWDFSWCTSSQAGLADILAPLDMEFYIGGEKIGEDAFRIYDGSQSGGFCRTWATLLSGWQPGDKTDLEIRYSLSKATNDGNIIYPAGEYRQIIHITVD